MTNAEKLTKEDWDRLGAKTKIAINAVRDLYMDTQNCLGTSNHISKLLEKADRATNEGQNQLDELLFNSNAQRFYDNAGQNPTKTFYGSLMDDQMQHATDEIQKIKRIIELP